MSRSAVLVDNTTLLSLGAKQNCGFILERSVAQDPAVCWQLFFFCRSVSFIGSYKIIVLPQ